MAQTAPPGYGSNYAAILDLIRFGYAIWTPSQMAALLFHAERSTAFGREADQHSASQAADGIYSSKQLAWVRGPAGISRATWHRVNNDLAIDPDRPERTPAGVLRKFQRTNRYGKDDPTEFALDWRAIRSRIDAWKEARREAGECLMVRQSEGEQTGKGVSHPETLSVSPQDTGCLTVRHSKPAKRPEKGERTERGVSHGETHSQSHTDYSQVSQSQRAREELPGAAAVATAIEEASGERPTDRLTNSILQTANRLRLPLPVIVRWIHDKCFEVRGRGYPLRAGLLAGAANTELIAWCKSNARFVDEENRRFEREASRRAEPQQMPAVPDPQFGEDLLREIAMRKAAG